MVCLWARRGIVLCCGAFFGVYGLSFICCVLFLVCLRFAFGMSWCLRYMMCTVFSMSAFRRCMSALLFFSVLVLSCICCVLFLVCRRFAVVCRRFSCCVFMLSCI